VIRSDWAPKIEGTLPYGTDLEARGMLWAALVRAPIAHGRIVRLDLAAARKMPGVRAVVGPDDLAGLLPKRSVESERTIFPRSEILYRGEPLAAVAADSLPLARRAARSVRVEAEPLPIVGRIEEVFPEWPAAPPEKSPHVIAHVAARSGDLADAFRSAELVHSETYRTAGVHQVAIEPHACLAHVTSGTWHVATTTQTPFGVREDVSEILGLPESRLVVEGTWVGGGFGGKGAALVEPYALVLAAAAGRPVKLALSFREEFELGRTTLPAIIRLDSAVKGGAIEARRVRLLLDSGASLPGRDFAVGYSVGFLLGPYRTEAFEIEGYAVRTNKPPFGPHRAPFAPQCAFAIESHLDGLARRLGVDPVEFRRRHVWQEGDRTAFLQPVGPFGLTAGLDAAAKTLREWRRQLPAGHGLGVGCGFWSTNAGAGGEAELVLRPAGLSIVQGEREIGNGSISRGLVAVAERTLGLPAAAIHVEYADTSRAPFDSGVFGSRTVAALGQAVEKAGRALLETIGQRTGGKVVPKLEFRDAEVTISLGRRRVRIPEILTSAERAKGGVSARGQHYAPAFPLDESRVVEGQVYPYTDFTGAVHVAEVAVDRETGHVRVIRYAAFHDVGTVIDLPSLTGSVEGGVVMGLGEALSEEMLWSAEGRLENPGLLDYHIPNLGEAPPITVVPIEGFPGAGPFGAKGMGEPPIIPVPAAVANAVADATGTRVHELPLTPERVARALKLL
jgi:CO/xanthine dehydrogenase Mo-binding subunit